LPDEKVAFDVFLSHNSRDKPSVRQIADALEVRGIHVWLDERELPPGSFWQNEIENIIETVPAAAVLVGKDGLGPWGISEMRTCLFNMVECGLRVIPVLLPGAPKAPKLPPFLKQATWLDLRNGITEEGLDGLQWGITGKKPTSKSIPAAPIPPRLHNLPFSSLGDLFKGRGEELRKLQEGQATALAQAQTIYGLGGIGKTRLAVEYAWRSGHLYETALFVVAESPEALRSGLANLASPDLLNLPEYKIFTQEERVAAVLRWLREHDRWLLILDSVDTKEAEKKVVKIVPSLSAGRVLITSRIKDWPAGTLLQQLETLSQDKAQEFIIERTAVGRNQSEDDRNLALRLAKEIGGLPLALEQAAAYIAKSGMSLSKYLEEWAKEREKVLNWYDSSVIQDPVPVAVTWQKTFEQLCPTAAAILRLTAYLAPDPIPSKMFEDGTKIVGESIDLLCEETGAQFVNGSVKEAITDLMSYSMVTRKEGEHFTVHQVVQDALMYRIPEKRRRDWIERSLRLVNDYSPEQPDDVRTWPIWDPLRPHAARVIQYAADAGIAHPTTRLINQLALLLLNKSLYLETEPLMRRALQIDEDFFGPQHPEVATHLNSLALLLKIMNRFPEAETLMRRALQIDEDSFGDKHPNVARDLNNLAQLLKVTNRLSEAEPLMRRALQIGEESFGPRHPKIAIRLNNLAQLLKATNRLPEAECLIKRALQIDEEFYGPQHPKVAIRLHNLSWLLRNTGRLAEAMPLVRQVVEIYEQSLGHDHPRTKRAERTLSTFLEEIASKSEPSSSPEGA
jgi:tetratricopeptide (TPR) repeat protein